MIRQSGELQIGKAGEYLVCADLILNGFIAYPSEQGLPYDVVLDNGKKLIKVQVKTTEKPRIIPQRKKETKAYIFNIKRHGKSNTIRYESDEIDIFAIVCIDSNSIGYLKADNMPDTINIRVERLRGSYYDEKGIIDYKNCIDLKDKFSNNEIANKLSLHYSLVSKYLKNGFKPFKTNAKYMKDFSRTKEWFYGL